MEELVMVAVKAAMEKELVKPAAVEELMVVEVKEEMLRAVEEVKAMVELLAVKEMFTVMEDMLTRVETVLADVEVDAVLEDVGEVDEAEEKQQEVEETENKVEGVDEADEAEKADVEKEADEAEGDYRCEIINVYNSYFITCWHKCILPFPDSRSIPLVINFTCTRTFIPNGILYTLGGGRGAYLWIWDVTSESKLYPFVVMKIGQHSLSVMNKNQ